MSDAKVNIGLPVYNGAEFLKTAIDSVLAQTHEDWEMLISDNGSDDGTVEIAQEYAALDSRISLRVNEVNQGAVANFEVVFTETDLPFFMWLSHDDWLEPLYLERCLAVLEERPDFVMAFTGMRVFDDGGGRRERTEDVDNAASANPVTRFHSVLWGLEDPTSSVFAVMRRTALAETGLIRNSNEPDRILIGEMSQLGRIHQDHDILFHHYGPPGHTNRDNWAWLNPNNRGRARFATFRIVGHQWNAVWASKSHLFQKMIMSIDLLVASLVKRTGGKIRSVRRQKKAAQA
jgi:glycosyltransferase involved in cell wall biosynthesis